MTADTPPAGPISPAEAAIFKVLAERGAGKSICPTDAARAVDAENWRKVLPQVRATALGLARLGRLEITRHGRSVDPETFKGVYRLRLPINPVGETAGDIEETPL